MARRVFYTALALVLAASAFCTADPKPDVNLFGVMFLFFAYVVWFYWEDIQAGYAYLDDRGTPRREGTELMFLRFAPMHIRDFIAKQLRRS